jgi:thioredoxin 1
MSGHVIEVSAANFDREVLESKEPVLVDFWAPWCGPCKAVSPVVDGIAELYAGRMKVAKCNTDLDWPAGKERSETSHPLLSRYGVRGIPYLMLVIDGKVVAKLEGRTTALLTTQIDRLLAEPNRGTK